MSALLTRKKMGAAEMATPASGASLFLLSDVQNNHTRLRSSARNAGSCYVDVVGANIFALLCVGN